MPRLLTLTTDFGLRDPYVAAMKAVMLGIDPGLTFVDVSHDIPPQDIMEAAFVLKGLVPYVTGEAVHLVVVDPGVGTERRPVALRQGRQWFVGPDNGLFSLLLDGPPDDLVVLDRPAMWRVDEPSRTFHGRDIFAPVAAHLARGCRLQDVGSPLDALERMHWALPISDDQGIQGWVAHVDHFGNCVTNIDRPLLDRLAAGRDVKCYVGTAIIQGVSGSYGDVERGEPVLLFGSEGYLEIAVNTGNAAELLGIRRGARVNLLFVNES